MRNIEREIDRIAVTLRDKSLTIAERAALHERRSRLIKGRLNLYREFGNEAQCRAEENAAAEEAQIPGGYSYDF